MDDPLKIAAAAAEERRLLDAGIAAEATRAPPRELTARRVSHENHTRWQPSLTYAVGCCYWQFWYNFGRCHQGS